MKPVLAFLTFADFLSFLRSKLHFSKRWGNETPDKIEVNLDLLCGLNTALAVTLMHKDFLNKLIEPVSYTHLDVYKRQLPVLRIKADKGQKVNRCFKDKELVAVSLISERIGPVSYTHLLIICFKMKWAKTK